MEFETFKATVNDLAKKSKEKRVIEEEQRKVRLQKAKNIFSSLFIPLFETVATEYSDAKVHQVKVEPLSTESGSLDFGWRLLVKELIAEDINEDSLFLTYYYASGELRIQDTTTGKTKTEDIESIDLAPHVIAFLENRFGVEAIKEEKKQSGLVLGDNTWGKR